MSLIICCIYCELANWICLNAFFVFASFQLAWLAANNVDEKYVYHVFTKLASSKSYDADFARNSTKQH